jgi:thiol-disulfide isomerase/thioredoxin
VLPVSARLQLLVAAGAALFCVAAGLPPTRFTDLHDRREIATQGWRGQTTLISFWAHWCGPCLVELRGLPELAAANPRLHFVAASLDSRRAARRWLARNPVPGIETVHVDGGAATVLRHLGNTRLLLPYTIVLDAAGNVCATTIYRVDARHLATLLARCPRR